MGAATGASRSRLWLLAAVVGAVAVAALVAGAQEHRDDRANAGPQGTALSRPNVGRPSQVPTGGQDPTYQLIASLTPRPLGSPRHPLRRPFTCPRLGRPSAAAEARPDGTVPYGALSVRLCSNGPPGSRFSPPLQALESGVDTLAATVNHLLDLMADVPAGTAIGCTDELTAWSYTLTFQYASGGLVRVNGADMGCGLVRVAGYVGREDRPGAHRVLATYLRGIERQRAGAAPPRHVATPRCAARASEIRESTLPELTDLTAVAGVVCGYGDGGALDRSQRLTPTQVDRIVVDASSHAHRPRASARCGSSSPFRGIVVLRSAWGDSTWLGSSCGELFGGGFLDGIGYWSPDPTTRRLLIQSRGG